MPAGQSTTVEVYGFAGWLFTWAAWGCYVLWALLPESWLRAAGITWYHSKYWALAVPTILVLAFLMAILVYETINMMDILPCTSVLTIRDSHSRWVGGQHVSTAMAMPGTPVPPLMHLPPTFVSRVLYGTNVAQAASTPEGPATVPVVQ